MGKFRIQTHGRLQEWVADANGYFADEGLEYEFVHNDLLNAVAGRAVSPAASRSGAFEIIDAGNACEVGSACHWAVNMAAATDPDRKMWGSAYSVTPGGIYVSPDSAIAGASDLAGVEIGVGYHSGSHFSTLAALERVLDGDQINLVYKGGPTDRLVGLLEGHLEAANIFGYPKYIAEHKGFRKVLDTTFMIGFVVDQSASRDDLDKYFRALQRAQGAIDADPGRYLHFYEQELPPEFVGDVDVQMFGPGERLVFEPYTRAVYEATQAWMTANRMFDESYVAGSFDEAVLV